MEVCDFLIECAQIEKAIEKSRQHLTQLPSYHPYTAFKTLDNQIKVISPLSKGTINPQNLQIFLHQHGLLHTLKECSIIFYKNEFHYADFLRFILPTDLLLRDYISSQEPQRELRPETAAALAKHLDMEISLMYTLIVPRNLFLLKLGTKSGIKEFFQQQLTFIYDDEIDAAIRRLDFYRDGAIDPNFILNWAQLLKEPSQRPSTMASKSKPPSLTQSVFSTPKKAESTKRVPEKYHTIPLKTTEKKPLKPQLDGGVSTEKKYQLQKQKVRCELAVSRQRKEKAVREGPETRKIKCKSPVEILEFLIDKQIRVEKMKQQLSMQKDFNAFDAFKGIDRHFRGYITMEDFDDFLQQKAGTAHRVFQKYAGQMMKFSDFIHFIQPQVQEYADIMHNRLPRSEQVNIPLKELFSQHTMKIFIELLKNLQEVPVVLNGSKQLFTAIDSLTRDNFIGVSDLQQYLYENQLRYTHSEVQLLIWQFDEDKDGRLSFEEFQKI